ncbi:Tektin-1, partial [Folsomia candida]
ELRESTDHLQNVRARVANALAATGAAILHVVNECIRLRTTRIGIDLTLDLVEEELQIERGLILDAINQLETFEDQVREQIGIQRGVKENLERDWSDKMVAFRIDEAAYRMLPGSRETVTMLRYPAVARFPEGYVSQAVTN